MSTSPEEFQSWLESQPVIRYAKVSAKAETVTAYMPANYQVIESTGDYVIVAGADVAGWTLDDYIIPRLASGLIHAEELRAAKAEVYHNASRDGFFGLNTVFRPNVDPKNAKQQAVTDEERHPLVKVFEYRTYLDDNLHLCERAFVAFNNGSGREDPRYFTHKLRPLSVGDVIVIGSDLDPVAYSCESAGFKQRAASELRIVTDFDPAKMYGDQVITVPWEEAECAVCGRSGPHDHPNMRWDDTWGLVDDGPGEST